MALVGLSRGCFQPDECYHEIHKIIAAQEANDSKKLSQIMDTLQQDPKELPLELQNALLFIDNNVIKTSDLIEDNELLEASKILELIGAVDMEQARSRFTALIDSTDFKLKFPFLYQYLLSYVSTKIEKNQLAFILNQNIEEISEFELYALLKTILNLGNLQFQSLKLDLNLVLLHYGLFILENEERASKYFSLKGKYRFRKGFRLIQEPLEYKDLAMELFQNASDIFDENGNEGFFKLSVWHGKLQTKIDSSAYSKSGINEMRIPLRDKIGLYSDIGLSKIETSPEIAIEYFSEILNQLDHSNCLAFKSIMLNLIGTAHFLSGDKNECLKYFEKAKEAFNCSEKEKLNIEFNNIQYQTTIRSLIEKKDSDKEIFNIYKRQKEIALNIYKAKGDHLQDFLVANALNVLYSLIDKEINDAELIIELLDFLNITLIRENKFQQKKEVETQIKEANVEKMNLLKAINEFKNTNDYGNSAYEKLFKIYAREYVLTPDITPISSSFSPSALMEDVNNKKLQLLGFLAFDGDYIGYHLTQNRLKIFETPHGHVDSLVDTLIVNLKDKIDISSQIKALKEMLLPDESIDSNIPLTILPDAALQFLPWHLIFSEDQKITQAFDLSNVTELDASIYIQKLKTMVFSYSDDTTIYSFERKEIEELKHGFNEAKKIVDTLKLNPGSLKAGKAFSRSALFDGLDNHLIHISSHSKSNINNRLDNYVVVRSEQGKVDSLFAYELRNEMADMDSIPMVVILSACESGVGSYKNGTGAYSLSRPFAEHGSEAIIKSICPVFDNATESFMTTLYGHWIQNISLGAALDSTRVFFKNQPNSKPIDWAAFVLEGNPNIYFK